MRRLVGSFEVVPLLDVTASRGRAEAFPDATEEDLDTGRRLDPEAYGEQDTWVLDVRCFVVTGPGDHVTVVDTGVGPEGSPASSWAPLPGHLPGELQRAGVTPADVDLVVLTHLHEDHVGWSVQPDGVPCFPRARYVVQRDEVSALPEGDVAAERVVAPLRGAGQLDLVEGRNRLAGTGTGGDGLTVLPTPGHTPGHQSVLVAGGDQRLLLTGDVLVHAVQVVAPATGYSYESDPETARRTRADLLAWAEREEIPLATAHLRQPFLDTW